jgi:hypothetical protein
MSSILPDNSVSPGSVLPDTDASSGEECLPSYHDADNYENRNLASANAPSMEELSTVSEVDRIPAEPDAPEKKVEESKEELEKSDALEVEKQSSSGDREADEEETKKTVTSTDADVSEEETEKLVPAAIQSSEEEETKKLDGSDDVQVARVEETEEETKQLTASENTVAKNQEVPTTAIGTESPQNPPVYQLDIPQKRRFTRYWILSVVLLLLLMAAILTPLIVVVSYGVNAYATYNLLRAHAYGGVQHLLTVKALFTGASSHPTSVLDPSKLTHARQEIVAAHDDFVQVRLLLDNTPLIHTVTQYLPQYRSQIASVRAASQVGIDATLIGEEVMSTALKLAPRFQNPLLSTNSHSPLVTASDLQLIGSTIDAIMPHLNDIQVQSRTLSLQSLPISSSQRTQLQQGFQLLPQVQALLQRGRELLGPANWLLGVDQPRVFLVQTMDRAELRPTGGFTGQYGELSINSGRVGPFSLHDISGVEYSDNSPTVGQLAPTAYRSWWPFANWGLGFARLEPFG